VTIMPLLEKREVEAALSGMRSYLLTCSENLTVPNRWAQTLGEPMHEKGARKPAILVVDDEPFVLSLLSEVLRRNGFQVLTASNGQQAVELYRECWKGIDLVLLDVLMPGLDGPQRLEALRQIYPEVCCCFMTGYTGQYTMPELLQQGVATVFLKPFKVDVLVQTLRDLLTQSDLHATAKEP